MTDFRKLESYDDIREIATWIYNTDKFTFNLLFLNDKIRAITGIERLIMSDYINPYHRKFITIIHDDNMHEVQGIATSFKGAYMSIEQEYKALYETSCTNIPLILQNTLVGRVFASTVKDNEYYLGNLYTNPKHRKKGIGTKLVEKCKQKARQSNCDAILLDVEFDKPYLLDFYGKIGFERYKNHYHKILGKTYGCYGLKCNLK